MNSALKNERYILVGATLSYKELTKELALAFDKNPPKREIANGNYSFLVVLMA